MKAQRAALATVTVLCCCRRRDAQWVNRPTPGIPRLPTASRT